jgi:adenylate kinase
MAPLPAPPQCVPNLIQRADDTKEVVKERLRIYNEMVLLIFHLSYLFYCFNLIII